MSSERKRDVKGKGETRLEYGRERKSDSLTRVGGDFFPR